MNRARRAGQFGCRLAHTRILGGSRSLYTVMMTRLATRLPGRWERGVGRDRIRCTGCGGRADRDVGQVDGCRILADRRCAAGSDRCPSGSTVSRARISGVWRGCRAGVRCPAFARGRAPHHWARFDCCAARPPDGRRTPRAGRRPLLVGRSSGRCLARSTPCQASGCGDLHRSGRERRLLHSRHSVAHLAIFGPRRLPPLVGWTPLHQRRVRVAERGEPRFVADRRWSTVTSVDSRGLGKAG